MLRADSVRRIAATSHWAGMTETGSLGPGGEVLSTQAEWREGERDVKWQIQG